MYNIPNLQKLYAWLEGNKAEVKMHLNFSMYYHNPADCGAKKPIEVVPIDEMNCGTTCCLAGFAASSGLFQVKDSDHFDDFSKQFADDVYSNEWDFLFSGDWPDDYNQMMLRIKYVIDNNDVHPDFYEKDYDLLLTPPTN